MPNKSQLEPVKTALPAPVLALMDQLNPKIDELLESEDYKELRGAYGPIVCDFLQVPDKLKDELKQAWPALTRLATAGEIATHVALQIAAFQHLAKAQVQGLARLLAEDISAAAPTIYELAYACRAMRRKCEFFSIAAVMQELERAKQRTQLCRFVVRKQLNP
jgi:hypothetical protein